MTGAVKVLDFGLAKAIAAAAGEALAMSMPANSPTITVHGTGQGVILGTAAYMSPEQARGKRIDKRTDIWAFGCVLYEMLTRRPAFAGETTSDVIAAIIERAPDLSLLPRVDAARTFGASSTAVSKKIRSAAPATSPMCEWSSMRQRRRRPCRGRDRWCPRWRSQRSRLPR